MGLVVGEATRAAVQCGTLQRQERKEKKRSCFFISTQGGYSIFFFKPVYLERPGLKYRSWWG